MSGLLNHSPYKIVQQLLVDLGVGVMGGEIGEWPIYAGFMPDTQDGPNDAIGVFVTDGKMEGREHIEGEMIEKYGLVVQVRSRDGFDKCLEIARVFDVDVLRTQVAVDESLYLVQSITRTSFISLGLERTTGASSRRLWAVNAIGSIRLLSLVGTGS